LSTSLTVFHSNFFPFSLLPSTYSFLVVFLLVLPPSFIYHLYLIFSCFLSLPFSYILVCYFSLFSNSFLLSYCC
jgi:hypothetical protein